MIDTINWIPVVIRNCTEEEKEMYNCDEIVDNIRPEDGEEVLLTTVFQDGDGNPSVITDIFDEDYNSFEYYDWDEILAWASFPKGYKKGQEALR